MEGYDDEHALCQGATTDNGFYVIYAPTLLPLDEVNEAFRLLEDREVFGRVVVRRERGEALRGAGPGRFRRLALFEFLGLKVVSLDHDTGTLTVVMPMRPELEAAGRHWQIHGGPIAPFIGHVGDYADRMALGGGVPTTN